MDIRLAQWLVSRDTGLSSEAIVARLNGAAVNPRNYPHDPDDLGRCIRLLGIYLNIAHDCMKWGGFLLYGAIWLTIGTSWLRCTTKRKPVDVRRNVTVA